MARMQMKEWVTKKNEGKAKVQNRWDNRGKMYMAFQRWRNGIGDDLNVRVMDEEMRKGNIEKERNYGIKHWGRFRTISVSYTHLTLPTILLV
eukprot:80247-Pleurochrysis_carterae.AAC.1